MRRADGDVSARVTQNERGERGGEGAFVLTVCCQPLLYAGGLRFLRLPHSPLDLAGQKEGVRARLPVCIKWRKGVGEYVKNEIFGLILLLVILIPSQWRRLFPIVQIKLANGCSPTTNRDIKDTCTLKYLDVHAV